jgi:hypothetical protein
MSHPLFLYNKKTITGEIDILKAKKSEKPSNSPFLTVDEWASISSIGAAGGLSATTTTTGGMGMFAGAGAGGELLLGAAETGTGFGDELRAGQGFEDFVRLKRENRILKMQVRYCTV